MLLEQNFKVTLRINDALGHALQGYTEQGTTWVYRMNFVMNHAPGAGSIAQEILSLMSDDYKTIVIFVCICTMSVLWFCCCCTGKLGFRELVSFAY